MNDSGRIGPQNRDRARILTIDNPQNRIGRWKTRPPRPPAHAHRPRASRCARLSAVLSARLRTAVSPAVQALRAHQHHHHANLVLAGRANVFIDTKLTTARLDRLTHHCRIDESGNDSYRFRHGSGHANARITSRARGNERVTEEVAEAPVRRADRDRPIHPIQAAGSPPLDTIPGQFSIRRDARFCIVANDRSANCVLRDSRAPSVCAEITPCILTARRAHSPELAPPRDRDVGRTYPAMGLGYWISYL